MLLSDNKKAMNEHKYDDQLEILYGEHEISAARFAHSCDEFEKLYGAPHNVSFFSAPGRTEVGGNHTDHQHGCVLAGSVNLDVIAVASKNDSCIIRIKSAGYEMDTVDTASTAVVPENDGKAIALIRGMCDAVVKAGYKTGGFDAYTTSNVLKGSGLSSSAAFEVLIGNMINAFYNDGQIPAVEIAKMAQYAENVHFGKPSGLMDQMASSVGGFTAIDFGDTKKPIIEKIDFDLAGAGHSLVIVDTGGDHADLTNDYAAITDELKSVSNIFGKEVLREVDEEQFMLSLATVRENCGDRAVIRAMHYFAENKRAIAEKEALLKGNFDEFLKLVRESGLSSYMFLQNIYSVSSPQHQGLAVALALSGRILRDTGAYRVHGGGFAGTIQAFVPMDKLSDYINEMEVVFGNDCCHILNIRPVGGYVFKEN